MRAALAVLIGIVGGEIAAGFLVLALGAPARAAFPLNPIGWAVRMADPITIGFVLVFFGIGWLATSALARKA